MATQFSLSLTDADILAEALKTKVRLFPFQIPSVGRTYDERIRIAKRVYQDMVRRGLIRGGDVDPDLRRAMRTLSDYVIAVAVMGTVDKDRTIYARASANGEDGVLAVKDGETIRLELIRPTSLARTLVGLLPKAEAGPGQSVSITHAAPDSSRARDDGEPEQLFGPVRATASGSAQQQALAASYLTRPRTGTGFFAISGRNRMGREIDGGGLTWVDTDAGRYLSLARPPGEDGQVRSTFSPADSNRMMQQLGELIESVAPDR